MLINFYSFIFRSKYMNFQEMEHDNSNTPRNRAKLKGVIVLTDNRDRSTAEKSQNVDFRCSAFKGTPSAEAET